MLERRRQFVMLIEIYRIYDFWPRDGFWGFVIEDVQGETSEGQFCF
jgi:hypothetical protein